MSKIRSLGVVLMFVALILLGLQLLFLVTSSLSYDRKFLVHWEMADRSSTLDAKAEHVAKFVDAIGEGIAANAFGDNVSWILKVPTGDMAKNFTALRTLSARLNQYKGLSPATQEYNLAIRQVTEQEQGEAAAMLSVFWGCYLKGSYPIIYGVAGFGVSLTAITILIMAIILMMIGGRSEQYSTSGERQYRYR